MSTPEKIKIFGEKLLLLSKQNKVKWEKINSGFKKTFLYQASLRSGTFGLPQVHAIFNIIELNIGIHFAREGEVIWLSDIDLNIKSEILKLIKKQEEVPISVSKFIDEFLSK